MQIHKSGVIITMANEKGIILYSSPINGMRKSKAIKLFLIYSIKNKDILKGDLLDIVWNTMQFQNIWELLKSKHKIQEDEQNGE